LNSGHGTREHKLLQRLVHIALWRFLRLHSRWVLKAGRWLYGLEIQGGEHVPTQGPLIVVVRHSSRIEVFMAAFLCAVLREFSGVAAGPVILNSRLLSWLSRELGLLPGHKGRGFAMAALLEAHKRLQDGQAIVMAADGEVPWDGRPQPLQPGAAWLALRAHAPVVPGVLQGAYDIWPRWASRPRLTGKLRLKIGSPFYLGEAPCERVTAEMLAAANRRLQAAFEALTTESAPQAGSTMTGSLGSKGERR
jgi:1-acyl-sn-glycerol-3-phosphate acyltransferase